MTSSSFFKKHFDKIFTAIAIAIIALYVVNRYHNFFPVAVSFAMMCGIMISGVWIEVRRHEKRSKELKEQRERKL